MGEMPTVIEQLEKAVSGTLTGSHGSEVEVEECPINEAALLIEQMQLTESVKVPPAPNHLLETSKMLAVLNYLVFP